jgi:hypothetical protein
MKARIRQWWQNGSTTLGKVFTILCILWLVVHTEIVVRVIMLFSWVVLFPFIIYGAIKLIDKIGKEEK